MTTPSNIGFGPYKGPDRGIGAATDAATGPGGTLSDGSTAAAKPTNAQLTVPGLSLTASTYKDAHGIVRAAVRAQWSVPTQGEHETDPNRVGSYLVSYTDAITGYRPDAVSEDRDVYIDGLPVAATITVRVRARTNAGQIGPAATASILTKADTTPPPVPSAPTITGTLRGAAVEWDGSFVGGQAIPTDFLHVEAQLSLDSNFAVAIDAGERLTGAGTTAVYQMGTPPFTVYARLRSVDTSGNRSVWSSVTSGQGIRIIPADVGEKAITTAKLDDAAVTANQIAQDAVTAFGIAPGAVGSTELSDLAVTAAKIVDGAIAAIKLAAGSVTAEKLVDGSVISAKLAENAVTLGKISANAVDNLALAQDAVQTENVADSAITTELLAQFAVTAGKVGFDIGGGNLLFNSNFADRGDPASPLPVSVVPRWEPDSSCTMRVVPSSLVTGMMAVETTFDPNVGQLPALS